MPMVQKHVPSRPNLQQELFRSLLRPAALETTWCMVMHCFVHPHPICNTARALLGASAPALGGMSTALPPFLQLTLVRPLGQTGKRQHHRAACNAAAGAGRPALTGPPPQRRLGGAVETEAQPRTQGVNPMDHKGRLQAFDEALAAGNVPAALSVLQEAAAAAGGAPVQLLGPARNRALLHACFSRGRPDRALAYLHLLHPDIAPWPAVMKEANKRRDTETLKRVLAAREAAGLGLDGHTTTAAIAGYSGARRLSDALSTFCRAWEHPDCRTVEVVNAAISACANQGNWAAAQEVGAGLLRLPRFACSCLPAG